MLKRHSGAPVTPVFCSLLILVSSAAALARTAIDDTGYEKDRLAILAMAGDYRVTFTFTETIALSAGYEPQPQAVSHGNEIVLVIADRPGFISLQHLLVMGEMVVKHWRQDWVYEPETIFEYRGANGWQRRSVSAAERRGKWAQLVYQIDDSPRYAAAAAWDHSRGVSRWTSPDTWRPLPRRDALKRNDYDVLAGVNRHVITPDGWAHEQDNTKLILRGGERSLVREIGLNTYRRAEGLNRAAVEKYWRETGEYWAAVRELWADILTSSGGFQLTISGEPEPLYTPVVANADRLRTRELDPESAIRNTRETIESFIRR